MPEILPFRGLRYHGVDLGAVSAPPYDVIDADEREALTARSPHNVVRLLLPGDRYEEAAVELARWRSAGVLRPDPVARYYGYRMLFADESGQPRSTTGVLGALVLSGDASDVLPHERTLPKARDDRLALLRATRANLDPIWVLSTGEVLSAAIGDGPVECEVVDDQDVRHQVFAIPGRESAVGDAVRGSPLVLADGHHRFETAIAYRDERRAAGFDDPAAGAILALLVPLAADQLSVQPIHRLISGVVDPATLRGCLAEAWEIEEQGPSEPERAHALLRALGDHALGLVDRAGLAVLRARPDALTAARAVLGDPRHDVPSAWFEALIAPRLPPGATFTYRHDAGTVAALVDKGAADAAVLLPPVTVDQIRTAALGGIRLPEKTTFFAPKPRSGLVLRSLDD